ncbi:MAG: holo-ACP synthase [Planctomycetota bacterium]
MVLGIGVDLCDIPRFLKIYEKHPESFVSRLFISEEMDFWKQYGEASKENLAVMFAGKEALIKAVGEKLKTLSYGYHDFQVLFQPQQQILLRYSLSLQKQIFGEQTPKIVASMSKTVDYAIVTVIIEG